MVFALGLTLFRLGNNFLRVQLPTFTLPVWFYPALYSMICAALIGLLVWRLRIVERPAGRTVEIEGGMLMETPYGFSADVDLSYDEALEQMTTALKAEGFGVLTTIDVQATLKTKLDVDFRRYVILGACNPPLAHRALTAELEIGLLLPCNVIVYERDGGGSTVSVMNASAAMQFTGNEALAPVAEEVTGRLQRALAAVAV